MPLIKSLNAVAKKPKLPTPIATLFAKAGEPVPEGTIPVHVLDKVLAGTRVEERMRIKSQLHAAGLLA